MGFQSPLASFAVPDMGRLKEQGQMVVQQVPELDYAGQHIRLLQFMPVLSAPGTGVGLHRHTFYEAIIVLAGAALETSGPCRSLLPGTLWLNPPGVEHSWVAPDSSLMRLGIWFSLQGPLQFKKEALLLNRPVFVQEAHQVFEAAASREAGWRECLHARLTLLLGQILRSGEWPRQEQPAVIRPCVEWGPIVDEFLRDNLGQPLALTDVAAHCGTSIPTLTRHLRLEKHPGAMAALQNFRLQQAADLLRESEAPVQEVARLVGMPDPSYFHRRFRLRYGCTPTQYRENGQA